MGKRKPAGCHGLVANPGCVQEKSGFILFVLFSVHKYKYILVEMNNHSLSRTWSDRSFKNNPESREISEIVKEGCRQLVSFKNNILNDAEIELKLKQRTILNDINENYSDESLKELIIILENAKNELFERAKDEMEQTANKFSKNLTLKFSEIINRNQKSFEEKTEEFVSCTCLPNFQNRLIDELDKQLERSREVVEQSISNIEKKFEGRVEKLKETLAEKLEIIVRENTQAGLNSIMMKRVTELLKCRDMRMDILESQLSIILAKPGGEQASS